jgi:2-keto-4-pentenoate hydratase/2-oxohepta-3-ene-1,7-dioic acid hydratase in catechol pathway
MNQMKSVSFANQDVFPSKIVCVGRNFVDHIVELGNEVPTEPVIFIKPNTAIGENLLSVRDEAIHYEGELSFIVRSGKVAGVGFGLDLTKRTLQNYLKEKGLPWERAKAFDGAALFSVFVPIEKDLSTLSLHLSINGKLRQTGDYSLMINKPEALIANIQTFCTLLDNDIVMMGTPKGVGQIEKGQLFEASIFNGDKLLVEKSWTAL